MSVESEIRSAKKMRNIGLIVVVVSLVFILASFVLSMHDFAELNGWGGVQRIANDIYANTQFPVLSTVWSLAARPRLAEPLQVHNLWFFGEFVILFIGSAMVATANKTLSDIARAAYEAKQQNRKDQFQKKQQQI